MTLTRRCFTLLILTVPMALAAQSAPKAPATKVGPPHGTVIVVGGGAQGPEIYAAFIAAAGGPDALIVDVPTAGGAATYPAENGSTRGWKAAGARNVVILHTTDRKIADSDSFAAVLKKAGGVWFEGGRHFHLVDSYAGTKTEQAFHDVLARGGVVGGSSAGASILGDFLVRGAPSNDNSIMDYPGYEKGFAFLRGVGIDQHVVARERLADLADSIVPKYPALLPISEDEGTAWVVRGDTATIIGRNKAFVYNVKPTDARKPFLTLHPGDQFNLATRKVMHRAIDGTTITEAFVDQLFAKYKDAARGGAAVVVARDGKVLINTSYGIPDQAKYMPTTTVPQFAIGGIAAVFNGLCEKIPVPGRGRAAVPMDSAAPPPATRGRGGPPPTPLQACVARIGARVGFHKTAATADGVIMSDVDELYRLSLGLDAPRTFFQDTLSTAVDRTSAPELTAGFQVDAVRGMRRLSAFGAPTGMRAAFVRIPDKRVSVIILTNDDAADAKSIANRIVDRLLP